MSKRAIPYSGKAKETKVEVNLQEQEYRRNGHVLTLKNIVSSKC
jgi:hypothetical protein